MARTIHLALVAVLCLAGVLMAIAMIPLIALILLGIGLYSLTSGQSPREITRRTALAPSGVRAR